jgi:hypothetical protein
LPSSALYNEILGEGGKYEAGGFFFSFSFCHHPLRVAWLLFFEVRLSALLR